MTLDREAADRAATRAGYDAIAPAYAEHFRDELAGSPLDRAVLGAFAELVEGEVLEVGSGPGGVTAHLHGLGVRVRGVDLSPAMVELARREHPGIGFAVGDMAALDVADAALGGVVAWYSLIHVPAPELPAVLAEFRRVLAPGGRLLLAFQVGDDVSHHDEAFGHRVSLDFRRMQPDDVASLLGDAGFDVTARVVRAPEQTSLAAPVPQAALLARRRR
ncbi:class I SAM-dependent methyltransferase [Actinomycetospora chlora]|uniref:Class I SAM-dependent methyltransferase n=1 Tax=Actinomycetospora chlora TaxID=663608 RepID=A0ABP9A1E1_9PSEU